MFTELLAFPLKPACFRSTICKDREMYSVWCPFVFGHWGATCMFSIGPMPGLSGSCGCALIFAQKLKSLVFSGFFDIIVLVVCNCFVSLFSQGVKL